MGHLKEKGNVYFAPKTGQWSTSSRALTWPESKFVSQILAPSYKQHMDCYSRQLESSIPESSPIDCGWRRWCGSFFPFWCGSRFFPKFSRGSLGCFSRDNERLLFLPRWATSEDVNQRIPERVHNGAFITDTASRAEACKHRNFFYLNCRSGWWACGFGDWTGMLMMTLPECELRCGWGSH